VGNDRAGGYQRPYSPAASRPQSCPGPSRLVTRDRYYPF
jgi:hypothetical protein